MIIQFLKYPRWCPKCKALHRAIWKECTACKTPLISSWWIFPWHVFKTLRFLVTIAIVLGLFVGLTYFTQKKEHKFYIRTYQHLRAAEYQQAWDDFKIAFWYNPVSRAARWVGEGIGEGVYAVRESFRSSQTKTPAEHSSFHAQRLTPVYQPEDSSPLGNYAQTGKENEGGYNLSWLPMLLVVIGTSIWVYSDAKALCPNTNQVIGNLSPSGWLIACLGLWILSFPMYLFQRKKVTEIAPAAMRQDINKNSSSPQPIVVSNRYSDILCSNCGAFSNRYAHCCEKCNAPLNRDSTASLPGSSNITGARYEFRYRWQIGNQEYLGKIEAESEETLKHYVESKGGKLIGILEKTKILFKTSNKESRDIPSNQSAIFDNFESKNKTVAVSIPGFPSIACNFCGKGEMFSKTTKEFNILGLIWILSGYVMFYILYPISCALMGLESYPPMSLLEAWGGKQMDLATILQLTLSGVTKEKLEAAVGLAFILTIVWSLIGVAFILRTISIWECKNCHSQMRKSI